MTEKTKRDQVLALQRCFELYRGRLGTGEDVEHLADLVHALVEYTMSLAPVVGAEGGESSPAASAEPGPTTEGAASARASIEESETRWREGDEEGVTERPLNPVGSGADTQAWATVLPAAIMGSEGGYLVRLEQFTTGTLEEAQAIGDALLERVAAYERRIDVDGCCSCPFLGYREAREEYPERSYYWCEQGASVDGFEHGGGAPESCPLRGAPRLVQITGHRRAP